MNPAEMTPREIDERLWELHQAAAKVGQRVKAAEIGVYNYSGAARVQVSRNRVRYEEPVSGRVMDVAMAVDGAKRYAASDHWDSKQAAAAVKRYEEATAELAELHLQAAPFNAEWQARQWSRFFLVTNTGGHVHSSMRCSTCFPSTEFAWLPSVSGKTEAEAVAEYGPVLCSVCFPTAPVEWTVGAAAEKAKSECPGSRTYNYDTATARMGYYTGNAGTCNVCGERVTLTSANKLRGHKPKQPEG